MVLQRMLLFVATLWSRCARAAWDPHAALAQHDAHDAAAHAAEASMLVASSLTRDPRVSAACSVRGNLGPCDVVIQGAPGSDWLKDRWQAASDMGGTAIKGRHYGCSVRRK